MNCKPGELVIVVKSLAGNEGRVFTVTKFIGRVPGFYGEDYWEIDAELVSRLGRTMRWFRDSYLRPLRDPGEDAQDESRAWLPPVPTQHKETAE